jgi:L-methionine (R)-S-oxide reductase
MTHPYLREAGVGAPIAPTALSEARNALSRLIDDLRPSVTGAAKEALYRYRVPRLSSDGVCSLHDQLAPEPYDLAVALGRSDDRTTRHLAELKAMVEWVATRTETGWVGIYQSRRLLNGPTLVKLAYVGVPSRPEFPLTREFAAKSNNSAVAMTGKARLLDDVSAHVRTGGAYYECDPEVNAEVCLPLFDPDGQVCGIIDAEATTPKHFTPERLASFVALALEAPSHLPR